MYRNDLDAAMRRAQALEQELQRQQSEAGADRAKVAELQSQLSAAHQEIGRLNQQAANQPPAGWGAPGYGAPGYGAGGYGYGYPAYGPSQATTILVLGILSLVACGLLGPFAWHMGTQELERLEAGQIDPSHRSNIVAGRVCGIIGTVFLVLGLFVFGIAMCGAMAAPGY